MAAQNVVEIVLRVLDKGSQQIGTVAQGVSRLDKASNAYHSTLQRLNPATGQFAGVIAKIGAVLGGAALLKGIVSTAAAFENYEIQLRTITGSSEAAKRSMDWITEFTSKTPYELDQVTEAFVQLQSRGFDATTTLGFLGDTAAAMGKPLSQAVEAFTDAATGEFERLKEFGLNASSTADEVTFSWTENGKQVSKTIKKTQAEIAGFLEELWTKRFGGGMEAFSKSFTGMISNLKDQFTLFLKRIADAGAFDALKAKIAEILAAVDRLASQGKLDEWARKISIVMTELINVGFEVGKVLAGIGQAILPVLPTIAKYLTYLVLLKGAFGVLIGLPYSLGVQLVALHNAFRALTGLNVVSWLGGVTGALTALGLVLATGFAISKISELIGLMRELGDVQKAAQETSEKYRTMAQEFEEFKDFQIQGYKDLMLMEDEELRHYYENLQKKLSYWNRYRASLEANQPKVDSTMGLPEAGWVTGEFDSGEYDKWQKEMEESTRQIEAIEGAMKDLGEAARTNRVDLDAQAKALGEVGDAAQDTARKTELTESEFKDLKKTVSDLGKSYDTLKSRVSSYYDFAADKAKVLAQDERQASLKTLDVYRQKAETLLQLAHQEAEQKRQVIEESGASEQQAAELSKQIAEDLKAARLKTIDEWEGKLRSALLNALSEEQKYAAEVKRLQQELVAARQTTEEKLRELQRRTMAEGEAWADRQAQAYETLDQAQQALWSGTEEGAKKARELAEKAQNQFAALAGEVKEGGQVVKSDAETTAAAMEGVSKAGDLINSSIEKQIQLAEQNKQNWAATAKEMQAGLDGIKQQIDTINNTPITPTGHIEVDSREVDRKLAELNNTVTHSTHIIHVKEVKEKHSGGWVGDVGSLHTGGRASSVRQGLAAFLKPGEVLAKLLKSEFVFSPEATKVWGPWLEAMNSLRIRPSDIFGGLKLPTFHDGGFVASRETMTLRLQAGDVEVPLEVVGPSGRTKGLLKEFEQQLGKRRLTRGR